MEIELKLSGEPEVLKRAFAAAPIRDRATGRARSKRLENIYYDTLDQRLRARGLAFRVRKDGRRYCQTLKSNDAEGLVAYRGEWQNPLRSSEPDLALMPEGAQRRRWMGWWTRASCARCSRRACGAPYGASRRPIRRAARAWSRPRSISARSKQAAPALPIAEVELELLDGSPAALYALALELDALAPLHARDPPKSARGYALAAGAPPAWHKAEPPALEARCYGRRSDPGRSCALPAAMVRQRGGCARRQRSRGRAPDAGRAPPAALRLFGVRPAVRPEQRAWLAGEAKAIVAASARRATGTCSSPSCWRRSARRARTSGPRPARRRPPRRRGRAATSGARGGRGARLHPLPAPAGALDRGAAAGASSRASGARPGSERPIVDFADHLLGKRHRKALRLGQRLRRAVAPRSATGCGSR